MTSMLLGYLLEPATGFTGSSMTIVSSRDLDCASTSVSQSSSVYWSNSLCNGAVVDPTALNGCGGGCMTCLAAACFAASFDVMPMVAFSNHCLENSSITSVTHSEVRPAFLLSQWRSVMSLFIPLFHSGHVVGALNHIQLSLLFGSLY